MTIIIYVVLENNKIQLLFDHLRSLDFEIERRIQPYIVNNRQVDVFTIQEIRTMIRNEFINKHLIDDFKIYKDDMYKVKVMLRRGLAVQGLEMITSGKRLQLIETSMEYSNIEFSKK
ncbi:MAG: hypothetical protein JEZ08_08805 [Clostridiales bacterium]|nr:hypothetical protein [Clostridiales bacterium]